MMPRRKVPSAAVIAFCSSGLRMAGVALDEIGIVPLVGLVMHDRAGDRPARAGLGDAAADQHALRQRKINAQT